MSDAAQRRAIDVLLAIVEHEITTIGDYSSDTRSSRQSAGRGFALAVRNGWIERYGCTGRNTPNTYRATAAGTALALSMRGASCAA